MFRPKHSVLFAVWLYWLSALRKEYSSPVTGLPFTSIVGYHRNPLTCGVARFNAELAKQLRIPHVGISGDWGAYPLLSLKWGELPDSERQRVMVNASSQLCAQQRYGVFWHDVGDPYVTAHAQHVFYADPSLGSPALFCPSLIPLGPRPVSLFTFGMAGKQNLDPYRKVRALLDAAAIRYHLRVSVGIHEGTSLDRVERHFEDLKTVMGPEHVTILGIMTDEAVSEELARTDYVLAFFDTGARANNTTIHAALEAGADVITNWDAQTPLFFNHATTNIHDLRRWPSRARLTSPYTWEHLMQQMEAMCARSRSTAV